MRNGLKSATIDPSPSVPGGPTWEVAHLYPLQGSWSEEEYLELDMSCRRLIEFDQGVLEFLPMPTAGHQGIAAFLVLALHEFVKTHGEGRVLFAPLPVQLWERKWREPDIIYLRPNRKRSKCGDYPAGADLVMEIVSAGDEARERDLIDKRRDYARARIPEYWIIDPEEETIIVYVLRGTAYRRHGEFTPGKSATSVLLPGFSVEVDEVFAAADG